jgi:vanillate O-demethylase monooxygenase subunit
MLGMLHARGVKAVADEFLRNCWYVAAWGKELARTILARMICGDGVVLYRQVDGAPVALEDRCAHRRMPLSRGRLVGDAIECGYHGLQYDRTGACVRIPGQKTIPKSACVRSYPVVEKWRFAWIWMGDPTLADPALIPDLWMMDHPQWEVIEGDLIHVKGNYRLVTDNLLDPSHVSFVHRTTLGTDVVAEIPIATERTGRGVRVTRWILDSPPAPIYAKAGGFTGHVDRWQIIDFIPPSLNIVDMGSAAAGTGAPQGDRSRGIELRSFNLITPETARSSFYFWAHVRNFALGDAAMARFIKEQFTLAFHEDVAVIEAVQNANDRLPESPIVDLAIDAAPVRARRILARLIAAEQGLQRGEAAE